MTTSEKLEILISEGYIEKEEAQDLSAEDIDSTYADYLDDKEHFDDEADDEDEEYFDEEDSDNEDGFEDEDDSLADNE